MLELWEPFECAQIDLEEVWAFVQSIVWWAKLSVFKRACW